MRRWHEALERCKAKLEDEDRKIAESFRTPDAILRDLEHVQRQQQNDNWMAHLGFQLSPFLKSLQAFTTCFVISMLPHSVETSFAWGVFSVVLRVSGNPGLANISLTGTSWCT